GRTAVVRIGHVPQRRVRREFHEQSNAAVILGRRAPFELIDVLFIHGEDQVEPREIVAAHLSRAQRRNIDPTPSRSLDRTAIRRITDVIIVRTGRIDFDGDIGRALGEHPTENALGARRAANIAHAAKQDSHSALIYLVKVDENGTHIICPNGYYWRT